MENELDYDLIERVGATHFDIGDALFKIGTDGANNCLLELCGGGAWAPTSLTPLGVVQFDVKPIPPRQEPKEPEYEYVKKEFSEPWEAAKASCEGVKLFVFDGDNNPCSLSQRNAFIDSDNNRQIYTRKEIKRDWRDEVNIDGVSKCKLSDVLIIDNVFNEAAAIELAKSILKAKGHAYE